MANKLNSIIEAATEAETRKRTAYMRIGQQPKVEIPKPGGGKRMLGIPTVTDRLLQQSIAQWLSPKYEEEFSTYSYGFRPHRNAHQAVLQAQVFLQEGKTWIIELDLEKFFDKVNHDKLIYKSEGKWEIRISSKSIKRIKEKTKTRIKKLIELGVNKYKAYEWGNSSLGYCRISHSPILSTTLNNKYWQAKGYIGFKNYYYWKTEHQNKLF